MNNLLNQQAQNNNEMYLRRVCEKHDYIMVTQTTSTTKDGVTEISKSNSWMQCKHCGQTIH